LQPTLVICVCSPAILDRVGYTETGEYLRGNSVRHGGGPKN
jgi:hypothetical protein